MRAHLQASWALVPLLLLTPASPGRATDIDGPDDCQRVINDRGDAPEGFDAYPGVTGHFPTCTAPTAPGTQEFVCTPISPPPGPTGFVLHTSPTPLSNYWLGCAPAGSLPMGVDSESDGKTSPGGAALSFCANIPVDCVEATPAGTFGQDECFGGSDAGLVELPTLLPCSPGHIKFETHNCSNTRQAFLNILIDMNRDGDWNDNFECPNGCAYEWAVRNAVIDMPSGCFTQDSPTFLVGPNTTYGWMRISISDNPAPAEYPWRGSAGLAGGAMLRGETEDYVVTIGQPGPCPIGYTDFGDAPEGLIAYPTGVVGQFPTCTAVGGIGTMTVDGPCTPPGSPPGPTGYVKHIKLATDTHGFWIGCDSTSAGFVDSESDGKVNNTPPAGTPSFCDPAVTTDCVDAFVPGLPFGQDECFGDGVDSGLLSLPAFPRCGTSVLRFRFFNCSSAEIVVYMNLLVDWNQDGDWNDVMFCQGRNACAPEWAVVNVPVVLAPGCCLIATPPIQVGPREGLAWMRVTLTDVAVPTDFPWNGSVSVGGFHGGETEDYLARIDPSVVGVIDGGAVGAPSVQLSASPNPAKAGTSLHFALTRDGAVKLTVYDVTGRRVRTLVDEVRQAGAQTAAWDFRDESGKDVAPGIYMVRLQAEDRVLTSRVTRMR